LSSADVYYGWNGSAQMSDGYFFSKGTTAREMTGAITTTTSPADYWLRSPNVDANGNAQHIRISVGQWGYYYVDTSYGFRPAGVFLENVTICEELCFLDKLLLFQREQVALQNLD
jgi:hypothetical protein